MPQLELLRVFEPPPSNKIFSVASCGVMAYTCSFTLLLDPATRGSHRNVTGVLPLSETNHCIECSTVVFGSLQGNLLQLGYKVGGAAGYTS